MIINYTYSSETYTASPETAKEFKRLQADGWHHGPDKKWTTRNLSLVEPWIDRLTELARQAYDQAINTHKSEIEASKLHSAEMLIDAPAGKKYAPYQLAAIDYASRRPRTLLADDPGLGKTIEAIGYTNLDPFIRKVLVICPATLRLNWQKEWALWNTTGIYPIIAIEGWPKNAVDRCVIVSYEAASKKWRERIETTKWDLIICDECFPAGTLISTEIGNVKIEEFMREPCPPRVWSINAETGSLSLNNVLRAIKNPITTNMVRVTHELGSFVCTENHKVLTKNGYTEAKKLRSDDLLWFLRDGICSSQVSIREDETFLFKKLLRQVANAKLIASEYYKDRRSFEGYWLEAWKKLAGENRGPFSWSEKAISKPGGERENVDSPQREDIFSSWGQWFNDTTANYDFRAVGLSYGISYSDKDSGREVFLTPELLQSGLGYPGIKDRHRSRWELSSNKKVEILGRSKDRGIKRSRVVSVEILEQGSYDRSGCGGEQDNFVYDLEIANDHSYFANGVAVSNCHYLKNEGATRTRVILGARHRGLKGYPGFRASAWLMLTGTPIVNRPAELWPLVRMLDVRGVFGIKSTFMAHYVYCDAELRPARLDELHQRLRASFMVRRLKSEVLSELPPKRRQIVFLDIPGVDDILAAEQKVLNRARMKIADLRKRLIEEKGSVEAIRAMNEGKRLAMTDISKARHETALRKVPFVASHVASLLDEHEKIVLWCHHHDVSDGLSRLLAKFKPLVYDGRTGQTERDGFVRAFQEAPEARLFIGGIKAAGLGLTLTAASVTVFAELDWTPAGMSQAEDRLHRVGQRDSVLVQHLLVDGSIDTRMANLLLSKQEIIDMAIDGRAPLGADKSIINELLEV